MEGEEEEGGWPLEKTSSPSLFFVKTRELRFSCGESLEKPLFQKSRGKVKFEVRGKPSASSDASKDGDIASFEILVSAEE